MDSRAEIERRRAEFVAAFNREDLPLLRELCADDVIMLPPNQPEVAGVDAVTEWLTVGFAAFRTTLDFTPRELYVTEGWAFDWMDWALSTVPLHRVNAVVDTGSSFWVWRRQHDGTWRVLRAMWRSSSEVPSVWAGGGAEFPGDESPLM